ncbi:MAG: hypothetical protein M1820_006769 [Bogoriella megaspora]|nr:MAG: hypothetical protein M1820_006769 [Bogoriella megaspora]
MCITYLISSAIRSRRQRKQQQENSQNYAGYDNARPHAPSQQYQQPHTAPGPQYNGPSQGNTMPQHPSASR